MSLLLPSGCQALGAVERTIADKFFDSVNESEWTYSDFLKFFVPKINRKNPHAGYPQLYRNVLGYYLASVGTRSASFARLKNLWDNFKLDTESAAGIVDDAVISAGYRIIDRQSALREHQELAQQRLPLNDVTNKRKLEEPQPSETLLEYKRKAASDPAQEEDSPEVGIPQYRKNDKLLCHIADLQRSLASLNTKLIVTDAICRKRQSQIQQLRNIRMADVTLEAMRMKYNDVPEAMLSSIQPTRLAGGRKRIDFAELGETKVPVVISTFLAFERLDEYLSFENEVRTYRALDGCNRIVPFHGTSWLAKRRAPAIVLARMDGNVAELLCQPPAAASERVEMLLNMALAVEQMHIRNIAHRDLKLANFLFQRAGKFIKVFLADFDAASTSTAGPSTTPAGTVEYAAPEQDGKQLYDYAADVYAFGACMIEIVTHTPGFQYISEDAVRLRAAQYDPTQWDQFFDKKRRTQLRSPSPAGNPHVLVDNKLNALIGQCVANDASARPTITEVVGALQNIIRKGSQAREVEKKRAVAPEA